LILFALFDRSHSFQGLKLLKTTSSVGSRQKGPILKKPLLLESPFVLTSCSNRRDFGLSSSSIVDVVAKRIRKLPSKGIFIPALATSNVVKRQATLEVLRQFFITRFQMFMEDPISFFTSNTDLMIVGVVITMTIVVVRRLTTFLGITYKTKLNRLHIAKLVCSNCGHTICTQKAAIPTAFDAPAYHKYACVICKGPASGYFYVDSLFDPRAKAYRQKLKSKEIDPDLIEPDTVNNTEKK
jgi:hypothetical protein